MAPRRVPIQRGNNANEDQAPQENGPIPNAVPNVATNEEFRTPFTMLTNVVANQVGRQASTPASRVRDFTRMNPPKFHGSKVDENPQPFMDVMSRKFQVPKVPLTSLFYRGRMVFLGFL